MTPLHDVRFPVLVISYMVLTLGLPILRHRRYTGRWPLGPRRGRRPVDAALEGMMTVSMVGLAAWALLVWLVPPHYLSLATPSSPMTIAGLALVSVGMLIEVLGQHAMGRSFRVGLDDQTTPLVTGGLFRVVRNPVFSGLLVSLAGIVLLTPSPWTIMAFLAITGLLMIQVRLEEHHLASLHGDRYLRYARAVGRFLPYVGRLPERIGDMPVAQR